MTQMNAIPGLPRAQHGFQRKAGWGVFAGYQGIQADFQTQIPCRNRELSGNYTFVLCGIPFTHLLGRRNRPPGETQFAVRPLDAEALGKLEPLTGPTGEPERSHCLGGWEIQHCSQLLDRITKETALHGDRVRGKLCQIQRHAIGSSAAPATNRPARQR